MRASPRRTTKAEDRAGARARSDRTLAFKPFELGGRHAEPIAVDGLVVGAERMVGDQRLGRRAFEAQRTVRQDDAPEDRVVEISRMLSGHPESATARAHAEELLALGRAGTSPGPSTTDASLFD